MNAGRQANVAPARRALIAGCIILAFAFSSRYYLSFSTSLPWYSTDTYTYFEQAQAIRQGRWLNFFPPGFPLWIALMPASIPSPKLATMLVLWNVAFSTATVGMTYLLSLRLTHSLQAAVAAGLAVALWPNQLNFVRQILSEVPCTFFLVLAALCFCWGRPALSGASLGVAALFRTLMLPIVVLVAAWLFWTNQRRRGALLLLAAALPIACASAIGYARAGDPTLGSNLAPNFTIAHDSFGADVKRSPKAEVESPIRLYFAGMLTQPARFLAQRLATFWELWGPWPGGADRSPFRRLLIGLRFPLLVLALIGIATGSKRPADAFLILAVAVIVVAHLMFYAETRYTFCAEPFLIVFASKVLAQRRRGRPDAA